MSIFDKDYFQNRTEKDEHYHNFFWRGEREICPSYPQITLPPFLKAFRIKVLIKLKLKPLHKNISINKVAICNQIHNKWTPFLCHWWCHCNYFWGRGRWSVGVPNASNIALAVFQVTASGILQIGQPPLAAAKYTIHLYIKTSYIHKVIFLSLLEQRNIPFIDSVLNVASFLMPWIWSTWKQSKTQLFQLLAYCPLAI